MGGTLIEAFRGGTLTGWNKRQRCLVCMGTNLRIVRTEKNSKSDHPDLKPYFERDSILLVCSDCEMAFVESIPADAKFFSALYAGTDRDVSIDFIYSGKLSIFRQIKKTILKYKNSGELLDIGAGTGAFLNFMKYYFGTTGVELGSAAREFACSKGLHVIAAPIEKLPFQDQQFDIVTIIDVLEHLTDPNQAMIEIHRVLKEGGLLYIKVPNYKVQAFKQSALNFLRLSAEGIMGNYVHINHFCPTSLRELSKRCGFNVLENGFSNSEMWNLTWKEAPRSYLFRVFRNLFIEITNGALKLLSVFSKRDLGFNIYILVRKVPRL